MKILIMTDMEGVAGVLNRNDWTVPTGRYHEKGKRFLTQEVNAAVEGFLEGGAREVVVVDGHGPGGIDPDLLHENVLLMRGAARNTWPWGLDRSFQALAFVGQHAKAGTPFSHLTHTQSFGYLDLTINKISIGEYGHLALCAMELGVPTILACGEKALCKEAETLTPGVVTVPVKRGLLPDGLAELDAEAYSKAKLSAVHVSPGQAQKLIREGAEKAIRKLTSSPKSFRYPRLKPPYVRICRFRKTDSAPAGERRDVHPKSVIALMNMPTSPVSAPSAALPGKKGT